MAMDKSNTPNKDGVGGKGAAKAAPTAEDGGKKEVSAKMAAPTQSEPPKGAPVKDEGGKAKIKMMTCISFPHGTYNMGQTIELPTEQAQRYVDTGQAEPA